MSRTPGTPKKASSRHRTRNGRLVRKGAPVAPVLPDTQAKALSKKSDTESPRKLKRPPPLCIPRCPGGISFEKKYEGSKTTGSFSRALILFWKQLSQCKPSAEARRLSYVPPGFEKVNIPMDDLQLQLNSLTLSCASSSSESFTLVDAPL